VELPRLILVRHAPSPEPGEGEQPPDEEVLPPLDMAALLLPAASGTQTFDAFDFYDGQRLVFAADLQLSWQEQEDGSWRYVDSAGDSATFLVTDTNVRVMPDEGGEIRYPRWPAGDDVMPYS